MVIAICLLCLSGWARGAEINLVYPRLIQGQDSFRYESDVDSSFIFGQVTEASEHDELWCNGRMIRREQDGAFLSFLSLPTVAETQCWILSLIKRGDTLARKEFAFGRLPAPQEMPWKPLEPPCILTVTSASAHTRTEIGGSYWLFPQRGAHLIAVAESSQWYRFQLSSDLCGVIDKSFVTVQYGEAPAAIRIGDATVSHSSEWTGIKFTANGVPVWREQFLDDGRCMEVTLYGCECGMDRIRYVGDSVRRVHDISWGKQSDGLHLLVHAVTPMESGYRIVATDSTFEISLRDSPRAGLRGKLIVIDPGHGGPADGAIGPRGTKEKDVVLNWAKVLARELEAQGATVALTRERDQELPLPDRVHFARGVSADVMLSLHANALPDGENPELRRGAGTYYFHPSSRKLAEVIHEELLETSRLADDGIFDANLAMVRPTEFPAILIEAAYIMQPSEELLLRDERFLSNLSQGVGRGLQRYFREVSAR